MVNKQVKDELREIRRLNKRGIVNKLTEKYKVLFTILPALEQRVMTDCYVRGKSYRDCGYKIAYCERQIYRIVQSSIKKISNYISEEKEL